MRRGIAHPGEFIREELAARGVSVEWLAEASSLEMAWLASLLNGLADITPMVAKGLSIALGVPGQLFLDLQKAHDEDKIK